MALKPIPGYGTVPKKTSYLSYGGSTPSGGAPYVSVVPKSGYVPGYQPGAIPSSAGYITYGGSTAVLPTARPPTSGPALNTYLPEGPDPYGLQNQGRDLTAAQPSIEDVTASQAEIEADPTYAAAKLQANTSDVTAQRARAAAINAILTKGGWDLTSKLSPDYQGDVDPAALQAGLANPFSDRAQIAQAYQRGVNDNLYKLAARGTLGGGAEAAGLQGLQEASDLATYTQQGQATNAINNAINTWLAAKESNRQNLMTTMGDVASRLAQSKAALAALKQAQAAAAAAAAANPRSPGPYPEDPVITTDEGVGYAPMYAPTLAPQLQTSDKATAQIINRIITPTKGKVIPKNIYQVARNVRAG